MKMVLMVQQTSYNWTITSENGVVIQAGLKLNNAYQAEEYITNYISSFTGWSYKMVRLQGDTNVSDKSKTKDSKDIP